MVWPQQRRGNVAKRRAALGERPSLGPQGSGPLNHRSGEVELRRSVSGNHRAAPTEPVVDAELHQLNIVVVAGDRVTGKRRDDSARHDKAPAAKRDEVIFEFRRPIVGEGVFDAGADHPAAERVAGVANEHLTGILVGDREAVVADPAAADLAVKQRAIPRSRSERPASQYECRLTRR